MVMDLVPELLTVVEWATVIVAFVMMGSGLPVCLNMYKQKSTANVPFLLFLVSAFLSTLGLQYGIMISNKTLILINLVAIFVWGAYIGMYILVSRPKSKPVLKLLGVIGLYILHIYYLSTLPSIDVIPTLGKFSLVWCTIICVLPVGEIYTIVQEKSTRCCDMPLLIGGTLSAAVWCLYGFLLKDVYIYFPSVPGLVISFIKFSLILLYGLPSSQRAVKAGIVGRDSGKNVYNGKAGETLRKRK